MSEQTTPVNASDVVILDLKNLSGSIQFRVNINGELQWKLLTDSTWFTITSLELLRGRSLTNVAVNAQNQFVLSFSDLTTQTLSIAALEDAITRATAAATQALASAGAAVAVAQGTATAKPSSKPSFAVDFMNSRFFDTKIPFIRNSIGTYIDKFGTMKLLNNNKPRFTHDPSTKECLGLLLESQRTNLILYSNNLFTGNWVKKGCTLQESSTKGVYSVTSPKIIVDGSFDPQLSQEVITSAAGKTFTFSVYIWTDEVVATKCVIRMYGTIGVEQMVEKTITISNIPQRFEVTQSFTAGLTNTAIRVRIDPFDGETDGPIAGRYIYVDCAQLEEGAFSTSFIPTTANAVTRDSDRITIESTLFSELFPSTIEGTMICTATKGYATGTYLSHWAFGGQSTAGGQNSIRQTIGLGNTSFSSSVYNNGIPSPEFGFTVPVNSEFTTAFAWKKGDVKCFVNGTASPDSTQAIIPNNIERLVLEGTNGCIKQLAYYPIRLPNVTLQALSLTSLVGKKGNQIPSNSELFGSAYISPYSILRTMGKNEYSIDGTGASITRTIRRPYSFKFEIIDSSGVISIIANPSGSCNADTDYPLTFTAPVGKCITYAITPVFEY